jgi:hypothetical protein
MCFTSDWLINLRMRVKNRPNIFSDQGQYSDPDFFSSTHQRENVQFADKFKYHVLNKILLDILDIAQKI